MELPASKEYYTYADYLAWDESERYEIIDGKLYAMATPTREHQGISMEISGQIWLFLKDKPCKVYVAPFGVRLFEKDDDTPDDVDTVLEPDISVVCDSNKLDKKGCKGAPDFVIEILSPSNERHDLFVKYNLYMRAGVREYWIVDPERKNVMVYLLDENGVYKLSEMYGANDTAKITVLNDCPIDLKAVFANSEPRNDD